MKVNCFTKNALAVRRQARDLAKRGYEQIEGPWQILRGARYSERISDVVIDAGGKHVWVKTEPTR